MSLFYKLICMISELYIIAVRTFIDCQRLSFSHEFGDSQDFSRNKSSAVFLLTEAVTF